MFDMTMFYCSRQEGRLFLWCFFAYCAVLSVMYAAKIYPSPQKINNLYSVSEIHLTAYNFALSQNVLLQYVRIYTYVHLPANRPVGSH